MDHMRQVLRSQKCFWFINLYITYFYTKILEVNLFAFAYRLFHDDFSSMDGALHCPVINLSNRDKRNFKPDRAITMIRPMARFVNEL